MKQLAGQLDLLAPTHRTTVYLHHQFRCPDGTLLPWWSYRCTCGHDVGADKPPRALYSHEWDGEQMAWHHRYDLEPWTVPAGTMPVGPGGAR